MQTEFAGLPVLVTGATGFIGSHLTQALVLRGANVHVVAQPNISLWRIRDLEDRVTIHSADICDYRSLLEAVHHAAPVKVFHLAALVNPERRLDLLNPMVQVNVQGTVNLLLAAREAPVDCVVNTGTGEEYGLNEAPFEESQREQPVSPYSATKVAATHIGQMMYRVAGLPVVTVRPFLTYGPAQESNMLVPALIHAALTGQEFEMTAGEQTREFNYVSDIVDGYLAAATTSKAVGEVLNLGNGIEYRIADVARLIVELVGRPVRLNLGALPYRPAEVMHFYSLPTKAMELLRWQPRVDLRQGLIQTIEWYKQQRLVGHD